MAAKDLECLLLGHYPRPGLKSQWGEFDSGINNICGRCGKDIVLKNIFVLLNTSRLASKWKLRL